MREAVFDDITAIILTGGRGERFRPETDHIPKPMIKLNGKPILEHILRFFQQQGLNHFIFTLCYLSDKITDYFQDGSPFGVKIEYIYETTSRSQGTARAVLTAKSLIKQTFFVSYGDIIRSLDLKSMLAAHLHTKALATIHTYKHRGKNFKSSIKFNSRHQITSFIENPQAQTLQGDFAWSNGALYLFEPAIFDLIDPAIPQDFASDIFPKMIQLHQPLFAFPQSDYLVDIANHQQLQQAEQDLKKGVKWR